MSEHRPHSKRLFDPFRIKCIDQAPKKSLVVLPSQLLLVRFDVQRRGKFRQK